MMTETDLQGRERAGRAKVASLDTAKITLLSGHGNASSRVWAIGAVRGDAARLGVIHDQIAIRLRAEDRVVYLGDYLGVGPDVAAVIDELLRFRCGFLMRPPYAFTEDIVHLRGSQEEMWRKVLQLQFAQDPEQVLDWMVARGVEPTIRAYAGRIEEVRGAIKESLVAVARWTGRLRSVVRGTPGHNEFHTSLKRAAVSGSGAVLFVNAGLDPSLSLEDQGDRFWWGVPGFEAIAAPYQSFRRIVRGADPRHAGLVETGVTVSLDGGCGFGGSLIAVCFDSAGDIVERLEA